MIPFAFPRCDTMGSAQSCTIARVGRRLRFIGIHLVLAIMIMAASQTAQLRMTFVDCLLSVVRFIRTLKMTVDCGVQHAAC